MRDKHRPRRATRTGTNRTKENHNRDSNLQAILQIRIKRLTRFQNPTCFRLLRPTKNDEQNNIVPYYPNIRDFVFIP